MPNPQFFAAKIKINITWYDYFQKKQTKSEERREKRGEKRREERKERNRNFPSFFLSLFLSFSFDMKKYILDANR